MKVHLTAKFKVHNPSRRKQEVMDTALEEYTHAYSYLLEWCRENLATIEAESKYLRGNTWPSSKWTSTAEWRGVRMTELKDLTPGTLVKGQFQTPQLRWLASSGYRTTLRRRMNVAVSLHGRRVIPYTCRVTGAHRSITLQPCRVSPS